MENKKIKRVKDENIIFKYSTQKHHNKKIFKSKYLLVVVVKPLSHKIEKVFQLKTRDWRKRDVNLGSLAFVLKESDDKFKDLDRYSKYTHIKIK